MKRLAVALLIALATKTPALRAAESPPHRRSAELSLSNRAGLVTAPFVTAALPKVSGFADLLVARAALRLSNVGWLHLEAPLAIVALDFPAGAQVSELALGNVELGFTQHFQLGDQARFELLASLLAPTAEHGPERSLLKLRALALAAALSGGKRSASLTSGAIGTRWEATVSHEEGPLELRGTLEAALLARLSNAGLPMTPPRTMLARCRCSKPAPPTSSRAGSARRWAPAS